MKDEIGIHKTLFLRHLLQPANDPMPFDILPARSSTALTVEAKPQGRLRQNGVAKPKVRIAKKHKGVKNQPFKAYGATVAAFPAREATLCMCGEAHERSTILHERALSISFG
jgi:hypothetical protein